MGRADAHELVGVVLPGVETNRDAVMVSYDVVGYERVTRERFFERQDMLDQRPIRSEALYQAGGLALVVQCGDVAQDHGSTDFGVSERISPRVTGRFGGRTYGCQNLADDVEFEPQIPDQAVVDSEHRNGFEQLGRCCVLVLPGERSRVEIDVEPEHHQVPLGEHVERPYPEVGVLL